MPFLLIIGIALIALGVWWLTLKRRPSGQELMELTRADNKVKVSGPITRGDIDILEHWASKLLDDAIELRRSQLERGNHPE